MSSALHSLKFTIGGFMGESFEIIFEDGTLHYRRYSEGYHLASTTQLAPSTAQIVAFLRRLDDLSVFQWASSYLDQVPDGTSWHLLVNRNGQLLETHGSNAYPGDLDPSVTSLTKTQRFDSLLKALSSLAGGRKIY